MSESKIKEDVLALAAKLKDKVSVDTTTGTTAVDDKTFFELTGVSEKEVKKVHNAIANYTAATALALGEQSIDLFVANPDLNKTTGEFSVLGKQIVVHHNIDRTAEGTIPGTSEKWVKHARIKTCVDTNYTGGQHKHIAEHLNNMAKEALEEKLNTTVVA